MINKYKWLVVVIVLLINVAVFTYLKNKPCSDGFCATLSFPIYSVISGLILSLLSLNLNLRQAILILISYGILIFGVSIIWDAQWAMKAIQNPDNFPGFKRSGVPQHGIWVGFFESKAYAVGFFYALIVGIGFIFGEGLKYLKAKIFNKSL